MVLHHFVPLKILKDRTFPRESRHRQGWLLLGLISLHFSRCLQQQRPDESAAEMAAVGCGTGASGDVSGQWPTAVPCRDRGIEGESHGGSGSNFEGLVGKGGVIREIWIDLKHLRGWMEMSIFYPCSILSMVFHCSPLLSNTIYNINTYICIYTCICILFSDYSTWLSMISMNIH